MAINTWDTKEQSNWLNLEQLIIKLNTSPIKFYVERKNYWYFLNDKELETLQSQSKLYLHRVIEWWIRTELKKVSDKDYIINWMINYLLNQIHPSKEIEDSLYPDFNSTLIYKFYNELYEKRSKLSDLKHNIWKKCSDLLKGLINCS